jgi:outer membrane receptor protein involved in Fe transport
LYGSYSEGFRSGFNQNANVAVGLPGIPPANEDTLKNYEVGAKGSLFGGRLEYDAAAYYIDWQDVQQTLGVLIGTGVFTAVVNGQSASGPGLDFGVTVHPTESLILGATFSWNDLALDEDVLVPALRAVPPPPTVVNVLLFEKGERLNYSAKSTVGATADYVFSIGGGGLEGRFSASAQYSSKQENRTLSGTSVSINESDDTTIGRASFALSSPDRWTASLFCDNVNNERASPARSSLDMYSMRLRPRTYGVQLEFGF